MASCTPARENWLTRPPGAPWAPAGRVWVLAVFIVLYGVVYSTLLVVTLAGGGWLVCSGSLEAAGLLAWTQGARCEGLHLERLACWSSGGWCIRCTWRCCGWWLVHVVPSLPNRRCQWAWPGVLVAACGVVAAG